MLNLYEFSFYKVFEDGSKSDLRLYQVPGATEVLAALELGRVFHGEHYELEIENYKQVG